MERISSNELDVAMDNHNYIGFNYNSTEGRGEHTGVRKAIPFAYGVTKIGNPVLRAFQIEGDTTTDNMRWKFFRLDRIENLNIWDETFTKEDIDKCSQYGQANFSGDKTMAGPPEKIISFNGSQTLEPQQNDVSGPITKNGNVYGSTPEDSNGTSTQSGPRGVQQKEYKPGDVIPYKEFLRRNVDFRYGGRKSKLTKLANDMYRAGKLKYDEEDDIPNATNVEPPQVEQPKQPNLGQLAGWNDNEITAKDQVNQRMNGLEQQLQNKPQKIDLSQFDKYEPTTNKKRW